MSRSPIVQYLGFEIKASVREYSFNVRDAATESREFTLTIANAAFTSHRLRIQDAPDICSRKLERELAANDNHPPVTHFCVSDAELDDYRISHTRKPAKK